MQFCSETEDLCGVNDPSGQGYVREDPGSSTKNPCSAGMHDVEPMSGWYSPLGHWFTEDDSLEPW